MQFTCRWLTHKCDCIFAWLKERLRHPTLPSASDASLAMPKRARMDPQAALVKVVTQTTNSSDLEIRRILAALEEIPLSRQKLSSARHARLDEVVRVIEVETVGGGQWQWHLCQPNLLFSTMVSESKPLQTLLKEAFLSSPSSRERPWSLVVGFDEFVPGNKLQLQPSRKAMNLSFTFLELGSGIFLVKIETPTEII